MANYRIDGNELQKNYQRQRKTLSERREQPTTVPMGNYRIDVDGNPILPEPIEESNTSNHEAERDYFIQSTEEMIDEPVYQENIYDLNDYRQSQMKQDPTYLYQSTPPEERIFEQPKFEKNHRLDTRSNWQKMNHQLQIIVNPLGNNLSIQRLPKGLVKLSSIFFVIYLMMLISGWQLLPFNKVNQLVVTGNNYVASEAIAYSSRIRSTDTVDEVISQRQLIEEKIIEENPIIESTVITRDNWMHLQLKVTEHQVVAKVVVNGQYVPILTNGELLDDQTTLSTITEDALNNLPTVSGFSQKGKLIELTTILRQVEETVLVNIATIQLSNDPQKPNGIEVLMKDGNKIRAIISTFAQKVNFYPEMVQQMDGQIGTINLEVGAYFIPGNENANSVNLSTN